MIRRIIKAEEVCHSCPEMPITLTLLKEFIFSKVFSGGTQRPNASKYVRDDSNSPRIQPFVLAPRR